MLMFRRRLGVGGDPGVGDELATEERIAATLCGGDASSEDAVKDLEGVNVGGLGISGVRIPSEVPERALDLRFFLLPGCGCVGTEGR